MPRAPRHDVSVALALCALLVLGAFGVAGLGASRATHAALAALALALALAPARYASGPARSIATLTAAVQLAAHVRLWQPAMVLALGAWALRARWSPALAPHRHWRAAGRVPALATLAVGGIAPVGLVAWFALAHPRMDDVLRGYVPDLPLPVLVAGAVLFAVVNAALEELIWRGALQDRVGALMGPRAALVVPAVSFGLAHAHGFPRGVVGALLAGGWGFLLGLLRQRAGGLRAPLLAHVAADATIATIVLGVLRSP